MVTEIPMEFKAFAESRGISLDHQEDWRPWYDCWADGFKAAVSEVGHAIDTLAREISMEEGESDADDTSN